MTEEFVDKLLYDFKYNSLSLEKTLQKIFDQEIVLSNYLTWKSYIENTQELGWILTDYKFNKLLKKEAKAKIKVWFEANTCKQLNFLI